MLYYRPHEIEGATRADWRVEMPSGEDITCMPPYIPLISHRVESFPCGRVYFERICACLHYTGDTREVIPTKAHARRHLCKLEELCHGGGQWRRPW